MLIQSPVHAHLEYVSLCEDEGCAERRMSGDSGCQNEDCF